MPRRLLTLALVVTTIGGVLAGAAELVAARRKLPKIDFGRLRGDLYQVLDFSL